MTAGFCVTSTPAVLTGITPSQIPVTTSPVTLNVEITGAYTHFTQGVTTVGLGPNITVNSVTVNSLTDLIANITIPPNAVVGDRPVFVNTINEQLKIGLNEQLLIGFRVGATSASLSPSAGEQGQSLTFRSPDPEPISTAPPYPSWERASASIR